MARPAPQAVLLVDGYNVVCAWAELRQMRDRGQLEDARRQLTEALANYSAFQHYDTLVVFDAQYREGSSRDVITPNLTVHYTDFGQTADTFIEKTCADFRHDIRKFEQRLIVSTSDRAQQLTVVGYGAEWMSAEQLEAEVEAIARRVQRRQKTPKKSASRFLANSLDPAAQARLTQLRFGRE